eukprot:TRINITY_DN3210_c0_g4_i1.p1 TRINITY_DN3210_c0_g4~~TRINITY_DN3210_c0_g4_i1.p1  ORF type:complete len:909 (-),score=315.79 TRINITY_DN3210_c0_g4_i1:152-2878(-)
MDGMLYTPGSILRNKQTVPTPLSQSSLLSVDRKLSSTNRSMDFYAEQESITRLREQLEKVRQLKMELLERDSTINDLRNRIRTMDVLEQENRELVAELNGLREHFQVKEASNAALLTDLKARLQLNAQNELRLKRQVQDVESSSKQSIEVYEDERKQFEDKVRNYQNRIDELEEENLKLSEQLLDFNNLAGQYDLVFTENEELVQQVTYLKKHISKLEGNGGIEDLQSQLNEINKELMNISSHHVITMEKVGKLQNDVEYYKEQLAEKEDSLSEKDSVLNDVRSELTAQISVNKVLEGRFKEFSKVKDELSLLKKELEVSNRRLVESQGKISKNKTDSEFLNQQIANLQEQLESIKIVFKPLNSNELTENEDIVEVASQIVSELISSQSDLALVDDELGDVREELNTVTEELTNTKTKLSDAEEEVFNMKQELKEAKETSDRAQLTIDEYESVLDSLLDFSVNGLGALIARLDTSGKQQIPDITLEGNSVQENIDLVRSMFGEVNKSADRLQSLTTEYSSSLTTKSEQIHQLEKSHDEMIEKFENVFQQLKNEAVSRIQPLEEQNRQLISLCVLLYACCNGFLSRVSDLGGYKAISEHLSEQLGVTTKSLRLLNLAMNGTDVGTNIDLQISTPPSKIDLGELLPQLQMIGGTFMKDACDLMNSLINSEDSNEIWELLPINCYQLIEDVELIEKITHSLRFKLKNPVFAVPDAFNELVPEFKDIRDSLIDLLRKLENTENVNAQLQEELQKVVAIEEECANIHLKYDSLKQLSDATNEMYTADQKRLKETEERLSACLERELSLRAEINKLVEQQKKEHLAREEWAKTRVEFLSLRKAAENELSQTLSDTIHQSFVSRTGKTPEQIKNEQTNNNMEEDVQLNDLISKIDQTIYRGDTGYFSSTMSHDKY